MEKKTFTKLKTEEHKEKKKSKIATLILETVFLPVSKWEPKYGIFQSATELFQ